MSVSPTPEDFAKLGERVTALERPPTREEIALAIADGVARALQTGQDRRLAGREFLLVVVVLFVVSIIFLFQRHVLDLQSKASGKDGPGTYSSLEKLTKSVDNMSAALSARVSPPPACLAQKDFDQLLDALVRLATAPKPARLYTAVAVGSNQDCVRSCGNPVSKTPSPCVKSCTEVSANASTSQPESAPRAHAGL